MEPHLARLRLGSDALRKRWIRLDGATADDSERAHLGRFLPLFHLGLPVSVPLHLISSRWEPSMMLFQPNQFAYLRKRLIDLCARVSSLSRFEAHCFWMPVFSSRASLGP